MHTGQSKLFVGQRPFKRTKQSWRENGCSCLFVLIWITEYASLGGRIRSACASSHWYFPPTLRSFSSGYSSCTDEKSNNPLDVIIPPLPCSSANSSLCCREILFQRSRAFLHHLRSEIYSQFNGPREARTSNLFLRTVPPETAHNTPAKPNAFNLNKLPAFSNALEKDAKKRPSVWSLANQWAPKCIFSECWRWVWSKTIFWDFLHSSSIVATPLGQI